MPQLDPHDSKAFRQVCGQFLTGVTIVTTLSPEGAPMGMTANSFTSVSLDPPLVLVCVDHRVNSYSSFRPGGAYAVHILSADQEALSTRFSKSGPDKFANVEWAPGLDGVPLLPGSLAVMECRVAHAYPGGDHTIFVGQVERMTLDGAETGPLGFWRGRYVQLGNS